MNEQIFQYVKSLTNSDTKTLSQKLGKTMEEVGELAREILPFDGAAGTVHRFTDRKSILEECVDVLLTTLSIAYQVGCTDDDIADMMLQKCNKWHMLQTREYPIQDTLIPYELHITVRIYDDQIVSFREVCNSLNVKPIVIEMSSKGGDFRDVMTSSNHFGDNRTAHDEMVRISRGLTMHGFNVTREKIETVPWHPAAPQTPQHTMPNNCYFESHIGITCIGDNRHEIFEIIESVVVQQGARVSRNPFKQENDSTTKMVTLRDYHGCYETFQSRLEQLLNTITATINENDDYRKQITIERVITEFALYDTNISHDSAWLVG